MFSRIRKMQEENEGGFTLIELLVVMIIIGILAAIAIPLFLNQRKNAVDASMKSDLRTVANEMESFYTDQEQYPDTIAAGTAAQSVLLSNSGIAGVDSGDIRLSKGNQVGLVLATNKDAYCLQVTDAKGTHDWVYVSNAGGLQAPSVTACSSATDPTGAAYGAVTPSVP